MINSLHFDELELEHSSLCIPAATAQTGRKLSSGRKLCHQGKMAAFSGFNFVQRKEGSGNVLSTFILRPWFPPT